MPARLTLLACLPGAAAPLLGAPAALGAPSPGGDDRGREVLLRGVNVNALASYWRGSRLKTVFPLERRDPARMATIGWNAVRLLISWSRVEPRPGVVDGAYLDRVAGVVRRLERRSHMNARALAAIRAGERAGRESCGDPHKVGDVRAGRIPEVWGEWDVSCTDNRVLGLRGALVGDLTRGYVRAAPGRLTSMRWHPTMRTLTASGTADGTDGPLDAFVPVPDGGRLEVAGLRRVSRLSLGNGTTRLSGVPEGGRWSLRVSARRR